MICQKCHKETPDAGDYCTHCGARREALAIKDDFGPRPKPRRQFAWVPYAWAALLLLAVAGIVRRPAPTSAPAPFTLADFHAGQKVRLTNAGIGSAEPVRVFASRATYDEALKSNAAGDGFGVTAALAAGSFAVPSGTHALVRDTDAWRDILEVRILTGPHAGRAGWAIPHQCQPL